MSAPPTRAREGRWQRDIELGDPRPRPSLPRSRVLPPTAPVPPCQGIAQGSGQLLGAFHYALCSLDDPVFVEPGLCRGNNDRACDAVRVIEIGRGNAHGARKDLAARDAVSVAAN